ncbi:MAG: hypothetical protein HC877_11140 [Thioploca sp.]|nr:hypothetical protein [Thioploca sp.]
MSIQLNAILATPVMLAQQPQNTYLRIGLLDRYPLTENKVLANVTIIIDKSASMQGKK